MLASALILSPFFKRISLKTISLPKIGLYQRKILVSDISRKAEKREETEK